MLRTIQSLLKHYPGQQVVLCYESPDGQSCRKKQCTEYKASRSHSRLDSSFFERFRVLRQFMRSYYWSAHALGWEADDVMYVLSHTSTGPHFVYTNDDDLLQCVDERGVIVVKSFQSQLFEWDEQKVREKYGVAPSRLAILRAFLGDGSDELRGCGRVERKYLASLIEWTAEARITDIDTVFDEIVKAGWSDREHTLLAAHVESGVCRRNYDLMHLRDVAVEVMEPKPDKEFVIECLRHWEIRTLDVCKLYREQLANELGTDEF